MFFFDVFLEAVLIYIVKFFIGQKYCQRAKRKFTCSFSASAAYFGAMQKWNVLLFFEGA